MNGVMADYVSPGSSHFGARVTCTAKFIWPSGAASTRVAGAERKTRATRSARLADIERAVLVMSHLAPAVAAPSTAGPCVVGQHLGHARRHLHARRQVDELVRAVGVRARSHDAGDEEVRLGEPLTEHAHEGDGP